MDTLLRVIEVVLTAGIVFLTAFYTIKLFFQREEKKQESAQKIENSKISMPLRIQAYERLVLLMERIKPESILIRVQSPQMTAAQLHQDLLATIRAEFEHNLSQQIYVSPTSWNAVKFAKDSLIKVINEESSKIAAVAPAMALSQAIITAMVALPTNPIDVALALLKKEAENYL